MDIKNIYNQLTNVNIDEQKQLWDERGKGYYGEFLLFCDLHSKIPGNCKILMNLNIPTENGKTTEIDLLMIHETGIYVFEVKHYKGIIYGKDTDKKWTQYFRTAKNVPFDNPMLQNEYHIKAIKKLFSDIPVKSVIVFTSDDCEIKVTNTNENIDLCKLDNIHNTLKDRFNLVDSKYSMEEINSIFETLLKYSQMQETILLDGVEKPFISWLQPTISKLEEKKIEVEIEKNNWIKKSNNLKKIKYISVLAIVGAVIACFICAVFYVKTIKDNYNTELAKFKQNFMHVDEIGNEYISDLNDYVDVTNISLTELSDNAVSFTARLSMTNDIYGMLLSEDSKYIVMTNFGKVFEYDVFGEHLKYNVFGNRIGKGIREYGDLSKAQFFGINKNDISYIKITNIELFKLDITRTTIKENLELELYSK